MLVSLFCHFETDSRKLKKGKLIGRVAFIRLHCGQGFEHFLDGEWCGGSYYLGVGMAGKRFQSCTRKHVEQAMENQPSPDHYFRSCLQVPILSSCFGLPQWWTVMWKCKPNEHLLPSIGFGHCFITAMETKQGQDLIYFIIKLLANRYLNQGCASFVILDINIAVLLDQQFYHICVVIKTCVVQRSPIN